MISKTILDFCILLINKIIGFSGLPKNPVNSDVVACFVIVKDVFSRGVSMVSWLFPNEALYRFCVGLTLDLITATLCFEIIALFMRIYGHFKK